MQQLKHIIFQDLLNEPRMNSYSIFIWPMLNYASPVLLLVLSLYNLFLWAYMYIICFYRWDFFNTGIIILFTLFEI